MKTLKIMNLSKQYGRKISLNDISLEIKTGNFGLLGPNGAGKTTLMRILSTILIPSAGEISWGDVSWSRQDNVRQIIGYLPQKFSLYKTIKVTEVLNHIAILKGIKQNREAKINLAIEKVNLSEHKNKRISELSGGMLRRVGIAQAILGEPPIIIVDEPTAGLDPEERLRFRQLLRQLGKDSIVLISTHIVEDIEATCDQVGILSKGQLICSGSIDTVRMIAKNKVWELKVSRDDYYNLSNEYNITSSAIIDNEYHLKVLSDKQPPGSKEITPTLEDGYLYLLGKDNKVANER
jgi:ABC-2 type transport system ATP-binding protein